VHVFIAQILRLLASPFDAHFSSTTATREASIATEVSDNELQF
jgi:hypothetical protein